MEKRSIHKQSHGGRKQATRLAKDTGTIVEEIVHPFGRPPSQSEFVERPLTIELVRRGEPVGDLGIDTARERVVSGLHCVPWDGLKLSRGEPAISTRMVPPGK